MYVVSLNVFNKLNYIKCERFKGDIYSDGKLL